MAGLGLGLRLGLGSNRWTPKSLGDLVLWLEADEGITLAGSDVSAWADLSGEGNNLQQTTAALQPVYATSYDGGMPAIDFTGGGTPEYLVAAQAGVPFDPRSDFTLMSLCRWEGDSMIFSESSSSAANDDWCFQRVNGNFHTTRLFDGVVSDEWSTDNGPDNTWRVCVLRRTGTTGKNRVDAMADVDEAIGSSPNPNTWTVGALNNGGAFIVPANAQVRAIVAYDAFKSDADVDAVRSFWRAKWPSVPA